MNKIDVLREALKKHWLSNWKACQLIKSASADRAIRKIRELPPIGFEMEERQSKSKIGKETVYYKEFRLVEIK